MDITTFQVFFLLLRFCLMAVLQECLGEKTTNTSEKMDLYNHNITLNKLDLPLTTNKTNRMQTIKDFRYGNETVKNTDAANVTVTEKITNTASNQSEAAPLPIPIMAASGAVAVGIFIFICVSYKWHTVQLDRQADDLAAEMSCRECARPYIHCSPCHNMHILLPPSQSLNSASHCHSDSDLLGARRKELLTYSPLLLVPPGLGSHRGSSWSAFSDQEVISNSPHRHSTLL